MPESVLRALQQKKKSSIYDVGNLKEDEDLMKTNIVFGNDNFAMRGTMKFEDP